MATGLKRDVIVILRMDGEDLLAFIRSPSYEPDMISIFSQMDMADGSMLDYIVNALQQLTVDHGMPPLSDSWVMNSIVEPALQSGLSLDGDHPITKEMLLEEFKEVARKLAQLLKEQPVIVAHSEQTFDGSGIRRLFSNKFEFNKTLEVAMKDFSRDESGKISTEYLHAALDLVGPSAGLPPFGANDQMDSIVSKAMKDTMVEALDRKMVEKEEFKKLIMETLENIMLQLEENTVLVSFNTVVHEPPMSPSSPPLTLSTS